MVLSCNGYDHIFVFSPIWSPSITIAKLLWMSMSSFWACYRLHFAEKVGCQALPWWQQATVSATGVYFQVLRIILNKKNNYSANYIYFWRGSAKDLYWLWWMWFDLWVLFGFMFFSSGKILFVGIYNVSFAIISNQIRSCNQGQMRTLNHN